MLCEREGEQPYNFALELFKSHYIFSLSYDESLIQFFTFLQSTISMSLWVPGKTPQLVWNMLKCFICQAAHVTCQSLISDLRIDHSFYPSTRVKLICAQGCCRWMLSIYSGLKKHLSSVHERDVSESGDALNSFSPRYSRNWRNKCQANLRGWVFRGQWIRSLSRTYKKYLRFYCCLTPRKWYCK